MPIRLYIVANVTRPKVRAFLDARLERISRMAQVVGVETEGTTPPDLLEADAVLVLGGDGTLLAVARGLRGQAIPLMGVNFGRLGFLANFTPDDFERDLALLLGRKLPVTPRQILQVTMHPADPAGAAFSSIALNDAVVTAGPPYHLIELALTVQNGRGDPGHVHCAGDGVIIATPSGSTAYNLSAGGSIIMQGVDAMAITPICPHSLSFRPVVVPMSSTVTITPERVNPGTALSCDGQASTPLHKGDKVMVTRADHDVLLFENPHSSEWKALAEKLHWAAGPTYNHGD